jgi:hypothetical protein
MDRLRRAIFEAALVACGVLTFSDAMIEALTRCWKLYRSCFAIHPVKGREWVVLESRKAGAGH